MKDQFDVWRFEFPDRGEHPVVLISHPDRCARGALVNVLYCTSQRLSRAPHPYEVLLNGADGMDWETICDCCAELSPDGRWLATVVILEAIQPGEVHAVVGSLRSVKSWSRFVTL